MYLAKINEIHRIQNRIHRVQFNKKWNITHSGAIEHIAITFSRADESIIFFSASAKQKKIWKIMNIGFALHII